MKNLFWSVLLGAVVSTQGMGKCAQIYYDAVPGAETTFGRMAAIFLQNLMGHFPEITVDSLPIEDYEKGDVDRCETNFYLGTHFDNEIPEAFVQDFGTSTKTIVWLGYNIWKAPADKLRSFWGARYSGLSQLDNANPDPKGDPGFYRFYEYKGKTFIKYGQRSGRDFDAAFEITLFDQFDSNRVVSYARHSSKNSRVPYILRSSTRWYVGDNPFSYITEDDRYLIFADTLFDMLQERPRHTRKPAFFRLEDVHVKIPPRQLHTMLRAFDKTKVPFSISLIPMFADPFRVMGTPVGEERVPMTRDHTFLDFLSKAVGQKGSIVYHGFTHQYENEKNAENGVSGTDYEFWNAVHNRPVAKDSPTFVVKRLEQGLKLMEDGGVKPAAWLTPHYAGSPLDNVLFGQLFSWSVGRVPYTVFEVVEPALLPTNLRIDQSKASNNGKRLPYLRRLRVDVHPLAGMQGQYFPYEIYRDVYGQRIIPESLGYIQPHVDPTREISPELLLERARRNSVLRDTWASFFIHPFLIETKADGGIGEFPGDTKRLEALIQGIKDAGYEFIDLKKWIEENPRTHRRVTRAFLTRASRFR